MPGVLRRQSGGRSLHLKTVALLPAQRFPARGVLQALTLALLVLLTACGLGSRELRMHLQTHRHFEPQLIESIMAEQSRLRIVAAEQVPGRSALEALQAGEADLALVENTTAFVPGVRAVLPVFQSVLHILIREDFPLDDTAQPMRGATIHVMNESSAGRDFVDLIMYRQSLGPDEYQLVPTIVPGQTDVIIYFGPVDPANTDWFVPGYRLYSLDDRLNPEREFFREGIGYVAPNARPVVIPALTYLLPGNEQEMHSLAVDTLLVTRKDVPVPVIYELTRTFLEQKPRFVAIAPHLFSGINESFDPLDLAFPLHLGARSYLERDDPGLLERYAETINMLAYLVFLVLTGFLALARWREQRKKDRVDRFYARVLDIRGRADTESVAALQHELDLLEREAFNSLIEEKLAANESFRIFTDLLATAREELRVRSETSAD